jgi:hypothetical protein
MTRAYRSFDAVIEDRLDAFRVRRERQADEGEAIAEIFAARSARIAGGIAGVACGVLVLLSGLCVLDRTVSSAPSYMLAASGVLALVVAATVHKVARSRAIAALRREPELTGDGAADLARLQATDPLSDLRAHTRALETWSVSLPLAALALLAPLTIHGAVALVMVGRFDPEGFSAWIGASALLVGLAHVVLAFQVVLWASALRGRATADLRNGIHGAWARALGITACAGFVPAVFLCAESSAPLAVIPPGLVLVTGAAFLPFAYVGAARVLAAERSTIDDLFPGRDA